MISWACRLDGNGDGASTDRTGSGRGCRTEPPRSRDDSAGAGSAASRDHPAKRTRSDPTAHRRADRDITALREPLGGALCAAPAGRVERSRRARAQAVAAAGRGAASAGAGGDAAAHLGRWSCRTMARAARVSPASVQRLWAASDIKPHLSRTFKLSNDKRFEEKFWDVIGLYLNPPDKALVLCCDEKSQCQALERTQPGLPLGI